MESPTSSEKELQFILKVLDIYRSSMHKFRSSNEFHHIMKVEQSSRELLVIWVTYCISFRSARHSYQQIMQGFGVGLRCKASFSLSDGHAIAAMIKSVALYLKQNEGTYGGIFTLRDETTYKLAGCYARKSLLHVWEEEKNDTEQRKQSHWDEVKRKHELVKGLRSQLKVLIEQHDKA